MNKRILLSSFSSLALIASVASFAMAGEAIDPSKFGGAINNRWLPLTPGTVLNYKGTQDDKPASLIVTVTDKKKTIGGVDCVVVDEALSLAGKLSDKTVGYYAQDVDGNVWYFGEDVQELNSKGKVTKSEGWHAGIDNASPSLVMEA